MCTLIDSVTLLSYNEYTLQEGCEARLLRRQAAEYFENQETLLSLSDRHTTDFLECIVASGNREANQDLALIASELAGLGVPVDSPSLPCLLRRSQQVAFLPPPQHALNHPEGGVRPCNAATWINLLFKVVQRDVSRACHAILKDPASCLLALAM
ncbi:hypothetical protein Esti_004566 [Eimeria stiedai]